MKNIVWLLLFVLCLHQIPLKPAATSSHTPSPIATLSKEKKVLIIQFVPVVLVKGGVFITRLLGKTIPNTARGLPLPLTCLLSITNDLCDIKLMENIDNSTIQIQQALIQSLHNEEQNPF